MPYAHEYAPAYDDLSFELTGELNTYLESILRALDESDPIFLELHMRALAEELMDVVQALPVPAEQTYEAYLVKQRAEGGEIYFVLWGPDAVTAVHGHHNGPMATLSLTHGFYERHYHASEEEGHARPFGCTKRVESGVFDWYPYNPASGQAPGMHAPHQVWVQLVNGQTHAISLHASAGPREGKLFNSEEARPLPQS